jgi:nitronate monooxygenase
MRLPLIAAPMFRVSGPDLVIAACRNGIIGSFPTANCRSVEELDAWISTIKGSLQATDAPFCPNLIMRRESVKEELHCLIRHKVELVITSVGSPEAVVGPLHDAGCLVFADVASLRHAEKAIAAGVDGLILLTAGAGGQTGWANGLAFARAVRAIFDGTIVMAGGIADGWALWASRTLGCDLAYMGTKMIASEESMASDAQRQMVVKSDMDDIMLTRAFTGLETNMLRPSIVAAGLDPNGLPDNIGAEKAAALYGSGGTGNQPKRWRDIWSAGHSAGGVREVLTVSEIVRKTALEFEAAKLATTALLGSAAN